MERLLARLPDAEWTHRHRGKLTGLLAGTLGTIVLTLFLVVAITGKPYGRDLPNPPKVYSVD